MSSLSRDDLNNAKKIHVRSPLNYDPDQVSLETGLITPEPTRTQQHERDETNINYIVQRFTQTGLLPEARVLPTYGDFTTQATDYQSALELVRQAEEAFASLPGQVRAHFHHDPVEFVQFMDNNPDPQVLLDLGIADRVSTGRETQPDPTAPPAPDPTAP